MPESRYEIYKDAAGKYRYRLIAPNNEIIAVGEAYETKAGCLNGIRAVGEYSSAWIKDLTGQTALTVTHPGHEKHLCKLMASGDVELNRIKDLVRNPQYVCRTCGMAATSADNLCAPEAIDA
jgi:uncharacterized protein YegP (UPF0339 family)